MVPMQNLSRRVVEGSMREWCSTTWPEIDGALIPGPERLWFRERPWAESIEKRSRCSSITVWWRIDMEGRVCSHQTWVARGGGREGAQRAGRSLSRPHPGRPRHRHALHQTTLRSHFASGSPAIWG